MKEGECSNTEGEGEAMRNINWEGNGKGACRNRKGERGIGSKSVDGEGKK